MKHTVHVTIVVSVEIDEEQIKAEYGKVTKSNILKEASERATIGMRRQNIFDIRSTIFESYPDKVKKVERKQTKLLRI